MTQQAIEDAITKVFCDTSLPVAKTREFLESIIDHATTLLDVVANYDE